MPDSEFIHGPLEVRSGALRQEIGLAAIRKAALREALELWRRKKGTAEMPARSDLSPREMASFLRNAALVKVLDQGREFQFKVVGDAVVSVQGASLQGLTMAEVDRVIPGYGSLLGGAYRALLRRKEPMAFRGSSEDAVKGRTFLHESLLLPLSSDGSNVDHILVVGSFSYGQGGPEI